MRGTRYLVACRQTRFRLRLNARDGIEQRDDAVQDAQGALDFDREVYVARCVDDVDAVRRFARALLGLFRVQAGFLGPKNKSWRRW